MTATDAPAVPPHTPWPELVGAALLGAERRTPPGGSVTALLDAAAVQTVRRRAGARPAAARALPSPAPEDPRPALPPAAAARLTLLLTHASVKGSGGNRGTAPDLGALLPQWLAAANRHGYRAPAAQVPALLEVARTRTEVREDALTAAGPRGRWLAGFHPEWRFALRRRDTATGTPGDAPDPAETERLWQEGLFVERVAVLGAVRRSDPGRGLNLLVGTWPTERAENRLMLLDTLREGLSEADEEFLVLALGDRSSTVRAKAAELLRDLPTSALAARMAGRARACVAPDRSFTGRLTGRVAVEPPHECDEGMRRDGIVEAAPFGRGERAWWLRQVVEAVPLEVWTEQFDGRTPQQIVALPVAGPWKGDLHLAWRRAAIRQGNTDWARALLGRPGTPQESEPDSSSGPEPLLRQLPVDERAAWVAEFIDAHGLSEVWRLLGACATPWSPRLSRAVVDALQIARDSGSYPWMVSGVTGMAERSLDPADADRLAPLAAAADEAEGGAPGVAAYWAETFQRIVATLRLRAVMLAELDGDAGAGGDAAGQAAT